MAQLNQTRVRVVGRQQIVDLISHLTAKALFALALLAIAGTVQAYRLGPNPRYLLLIGGAVASAAAMLAYAFLVIFTGGKARRGFVPMIIGFGGFVPYIFGCYLFFYEGLWSLRHLLSGFSSSQLAAGSFFVLIGYATVYGIYQVSELGRQVDEGVVLIDPEGAV
jgi:hypothetical protein